MGLQHLMSGLQQVSDLVLLRVRTAMDFLLMQHLSASWLCANV